MGLTAGLSEPEGQGSAAPDRSGLALAQALVRWRWPLSLLVLASVPFVVAPVVLFGRRVRQFVYRILRAFERPILG